MKSQQEKQDDVGSKSEEEEMKNTPMGLVEESNFSYSTTPNKIEDISRMLVGLGSFL